MIYDSVTGKKSRKNVKICKTVKSDNYLAVYDNFRAILSHRSSYDFVPTADFTGVPFTLVHYFYTCSNLARDLPRQLGRIDEKS